jgi:hypothetical protein
LRRELQQMDEALAAGGIRLGVLRAERVAAATQLEASAARMRRLEEEGASDPEQQLARLEAQYAESAIAEIDLITEVVGLQERVANSRRQQAASRAGASRRCPRERRGPGRARTRPRCAPGRLQLPPRPGRGPP